MSLKSLVLPERMVNEEDIVRAVSIKPLVLPERMVNEEDIVRAVSLKSLSYLRGWSMKRM